MHLLQISLQPLGIIRIPRKIILINPPLNLATPYHIHVLGTSLNVMANAQKPTFVSGRNGRVHLNRRGRHFSRLMASEECASVVVMLDTPCFEEV